MHSLSSFAFFVDDNLNPDPVKFQGFVMAWDGSKASGPIFFQSGGRFLGGFAAHHGKASLGWKF